MSEKTFIQKIYAAFYGLAFAADLNVALVWLAATILVIYLPILNETLIRYVIILPGILFLPGYCLIAALFPKDRDIDHIERLALSFGLSITVVALIGLALNFTPFGIRLESILLSVTVFTLVMILVAHYRRAILLSEERFRVPFFAIAGALQDAVFSGKSSRVDRILSVVLTLVIIITILATFSLIALPKEGERFTEFFILGEKQKAADYPERIVAGQNYPMFFGIGNHEYHDTRYTIETWMVRTVFDNVTNSSRIMAMDPNGRLSRTLPHNETIIIPYNLSVKNSGYNRMEFLLFNDTLPGPDVQGSDRINASYRDLNLWITVR